MLTRIAVAVGLPSRSSPGLKRLLDMHVRAAAPKPCLGGDSDSSLTFETEPFLPIVTITAAEATSSAAPPGK